MTWLALWVIGVAAADVVRGVDQSRRRAVPAGVTGVVTVLALWLLAGLLRPADLVALAVGVAGLAAWVLLTTPRSRRPITIALAALAVPVLLFVGFGGAASRVGGPLATWWEWTSVPAGRTVSVERTLLVVAAVTFQLSTANWVVRIVLRATGVHQADHSNEFTAEQQLKGGRLIGPMERLFILGLGLLGQLTAATVITAAKGLLRFPELRALSEPLVLPSGESAMTRRDQERISATTEYFLVGTFTSWLCATASLVLLR